MAGERRINWGADATDAQYRTGDDDANNRFIVAEDLNGGTVLLEYDESAGEFVYRGPVNMDGNDVSNVGALDATSVSTSQANVDGETFVRLSRSNDTNTIGSNTFTNLYDTTEKDNLTEINNNQQFSPDEDGEYEIVVNADIRGSTVENDSIRLRINNISGTAPVGDDVVAHQATGSEAMQAILQVRLFSDGVYEIQGKNKDNDFTISKFNSTATIKRSIVHD